MKELNPPETQLRSWQPRRPSAKVERRIFAASTRRSAVVMWSLRCLAPAAACLLVTMTALNHGNRIPADGSSPDLLLGMIGSNRIAYLPGDYQQAQNRLSSLTFEWTKHSASTSSIGSFSPGKVN